MKIYRFLFILACLFSLVGCSKEWNCKCEIYSNGQLQEGDTTIEIIEGKKDEASLECLKKSHNEVFYGVNVETQCNIEK